MFFANDSQGLQEIAVTGGGFEFHDGGGGGHFFFELVDDVFLPPAQKSGNFLNKSFICLGRHGVNAGGQALIDVGVETRFLGHLAAFTQRKQPVEQGRGFPGRGGAGVGAEVFTRFAAPGFGGGNLAFDLAGDKDTRVGLGGDQDVGIGFAVPQQNVVGGLVFFDEIVFENQGFNFGLGEDVFEINDLADHFLGFGVMGTGKIGAHAVFQHFSLADIDNAPRLVAH